jgi:hypothetical protein
MEKRTSAICSALYYGAAALLMHLPNEGVDVKASDEEFALHEKRHRSSSCVFRL